MYISGLQCYALALLVQLWGWPGGEAPLTQIDYALVAKSLLKQAKVKAGKAGNLPA